MNSKRLLSLVSLTALVSIGAANAQTYFTGSFSFVSLGSGGAYTASSLTLTGTNYINTVSASGTFSAFLNDGVIAYTPSVNGLSGTAKAENIPLYFVLALPSPVSPSLGNGGNGGVYHFTLTSLTESALGIFSGEGVLMDANNVLADTPAEFSVAFSSSDNYVVSFSAIPVPEPSALAVLAVGAALLLLADTRLRRKRVAEV